MGNNNEDFIREINNILTADQTNMINEGYKVVEARDIKLIGKKLKDIYTEVINNQYK